MKVRVRYFAMLREAAGRREEAVEVRTGSAVEDLVELLKGRLGEVCPWEHVAVAVNHEASSRAQRLRDDDLVAILPPVSGG